MRTLLGLFCCVAACQSGKPETVIGGVSAAVSADVVTVVTAGWTTDPAAPARVRYGVDGDLSLETPWVDGPTAEVPLLGLPADAAVSLQVEAEDGAVSEVIEVATGPLPGSLPSLTGGGADHDHYSVTPVIGTVTGPVIISPEGQIVWYYLDDRGLETYRARPARDGSGLWYSAASVSGDPSEDSALVWVSWDGAGEVAVPVPLLAHDFVELPDGTMAAIQVEFREVDGEVVRGDRIVEIDAEGELTEVWSAWDCLDPAVTPGDDPVLGWTFVNALDYDEAADEYTVSVRNLSTILRIDRASGACMWGLGGEAGTLEVSGDAFYHEHQFEIVDGHALVFDNAGAGVTRSRAIEYALDLDAGTATEVWSYSPDPAVASFVLGDVARFDDGDTLVTFSVAGRIDRVSADGELLWTLQSSLGAAFGFNTVVESLYGDGE